MKSSSPTSNACPVCKSAISKEKIIPIYTKAGDKDPRETEEERPPGQREEAQPENNDFFNDFGNFFNMNGGGGPGGTGMWGMGPFGMFFPNVVFNFGANTNFNVGFGGGMALPFLMSGYRYIRNYITGAPQNPRDNPFNAAHWQSWVVAFIVIFNLCNLYAAVRSFF